MQSIWCDRMAISRWRIRRPAPRHLPPISTSARSSYVHRLDVDELADAVRRKLAAVAALLDAAERQTGVRAHRFVDKNAAAFDQFGCDALAARQVARDDGAA